MPKETLTPDVRVASSFLDEKYDDKAVRGEVVMDKIDAELFIKRPLDNRLVSFMRRWTYVYETISEFNYQVQNHSDYKYPDTNAVYLSLIYDIRNIMDKQEVNILTHDIRFKETDDVCGRVEFNISPRCNAFFMRAKSRDNDRKSTNFLSFEYNKMEDNDLTVRPVEYKDMRYWKNGSAVVDFTVSTRGIDADGLEKTVEVQAIRCVRINEHTYLEFPDQYDAGLKEVQSIHIRINGMKFPKLQYAFDVYMNLPEEETFPFHKLIEVDYAAYIKTIEVWTFVDRNRDIPANNDNMFVNQLMDADYLVEFMQKLKKCGDGNGLIPSIKRPSQSIWTVNNGWAEMVRTVSRGNEKIMQDCETDLEALERYLYYVRYINTEFTFDINDVNGLYIQQFTKDTYKPLAIGVPTE